jgi:hypothetical protein
VSNVCNACEIERIGCSCDGSLDDGCFFCKPEKHERPPCSPECPNRIGEERRKVAFNAKAIASMKAVVEHMGRERSEKEKEREKQFDAMVEACVFKSGEHVQLPATQEVIDRGGVRLYTVTTIASSERFGGTRTVTVCDKFEQAKEIIENNHGDIYECSYSLAVIDTFVAGWLYHYLDEQYWYRWVRDADGVYGSYKAIERPVEYYNITAVGGIG